MRDLDDISGSSNGGEAEKKATDCDCATNEGECGSGSVCISFTQRSFSVQYDERTFGNGNSDGKVLRETRVGAKWQLLWEVW